jgi:hypothetical protein
MKNHAVPNCIFGAARGADGDQRVACGVVSLLTSHAEVVREGIGA